MTVLSADRKAEEFRYHLARGRDPSYFAREMLGVTLNPAQERWFRLVGTMPDGWSWIHRQVIHVAANQIGKTLGLGILILWAGTYKIGLSSADWDYWLAQPYKWYHLAPSAPQARLTLYDIRALVLGEHPSQFEKGTMKVRPGYRWVPGLVEDVVFEKYYDGLQFWNGTQVQFRATDEKGKTLQGVRANGVSFDEAAYEHHLADVVGQLIQMRLISTGGPLWMVSTPDGINDFFEFVQDILNQGTQTFHERVWEVKARRRALLWSHISDNVGYGITAEQAAEAEDSFPDEGDRERALRGAFIRSRDVYFTPTESVTAAWVAGLRDREEPKPGHRYVAFWDISIKNDATVLTVLDVSRTPWRGVYFERWEVPMGWDALQEAIKTTHSKWNTAADKVGNRSSCITGYDSTSLGGAIMTHALARVNPKRPVNFAGPQKKTMLANARAALTSKAVVLPTSWVRPLREVLNYQLEDARLVQDCVMSLIGALHLASQGRSGQQSAPFDPGTKTNYDAWRTRRT